MHKSFLYLRLWRSCVNICGSYVAVGEPGRCLANVPYFVSGSPSSFCAVGRKCFRSNQR
jgi:hypothetical protein